MLLPLAAVSAQAAPVASEVTIAQASGDDDGVDVRGSVKSAIANCKANRRVRVYHDVPPPGRSPDDFFLGEAVTNNQGRWRVSTDFLPDKVYARVLRKSRRGARACGSDTSPTKTVVFD